MERTRLGSAGALLVALLLAGCSGGPEGNDGRTSSVTPAPIVTPSSAYAPFHYVNDAQRKAYEAFIGCAQAHGLRYDGPFTDSTGKGVFLRLAPTEDATRAERDEVSTACPQFVVASFGTPVGHVHKGAFHDASAAFAACIRNHGDPGFPAPRLRSGNAIEAFWRLPFDWSSARFVDVVKKCVDPLKSYLFAGSP